MKALQSLILLLGITFTLSGQKNDEPLAGKWQNDDKSMIIEFYRAGNNLWNARIIWLKNDTDAHGEPLRDVHNSNPSLRTRKITGIDLLTGLSEKSSNDKWTGGSIYNHQNGQTYNALIFLKDENTIQVKGYWWFFRFLGGNTQWTKLKSK
jgi:uncharacterized protein (DUF2147 family)